MIDFTRLIKDQVTYWPLSGTNAQGFRTFGSPKLLKGRWERRTEQATDDEGEQVTADAVVYLLEPVSPGGYIHFGDKRSVADPTTLAGARRIIDFRQIPPVSGDPEDPEQAENRALLTG